MYNKILRKWDLQLKDRKKYLVKSAAALLCSLSMVFPADVLTYADGSTSYNYNLNDAKQCLKLALGINEMPADETQKNEYMNKFDTDNNSQVNLVDANTVLKYALGILTPPDNGNGKADDNGKNDGSKEDYPDFDDSPVVNAGLSEKLTPPAVAAESVNLDKLKEEGVSVFPYELYQYTYYNGYYGFFYEDNILDELHELYDLKAEAGDISVAVLPWSDLQNFNSWEEYISITGMSYYKAEVSNSDWDSEFYKPELSTLLSVSGEAVTPASVEVSGDAAFTLYSMAYFDDYKTERWYLNYNYDEEFYGYYYGPFGNLIGSEDDVYYAASSSAVMTLGEWDVVKDNSTVKENISFYYLNPIILPTLEEQGYGEEIPEDNPYDKYMSGCDKEFYEVMKEKDPVTDSNLWNGTATVDSKLLTASLDITGYGEMTVPLYKLGVYNGMFGYFGTTLTSDEEDDLYNATENEFRDFIGKYVKDFPFWSFVNESASFDIPGENACVYFEYLYMPDKSWLGPYYPDDADYAVITRNFFRDNEPKYYSNAYKKFWYFNVMNECIYSYEKLRVDNAYIKAPMEIERIAHDKISKASDSAYEMLFPSGHDNILYNPDL